MDQYAEIIGDNASVDDYRKIAGHFENSGDHYKAGNFFFASKDYDKVIFCFIHWYKYSIAQPFQALHHLLHCPVIHEGEGIDMAIKVVSEAKQEMLTQRLMDYLIGDLDATPKVSTSH